MGTESLGSCPRDEPIESDGGRGEGLTGPGETTVPLSDPGAPAPSAGPAPVSTVWDPELGDGPAVAAGTTFEDRPTDVLDEPTAVLTEEYLRSLSRVGSLSEAEIDAARAALETDGTMVSESGALGRLTVALVEGGRLTGEQAAAVIADRRGDRILGHYVLISKLGEGGMGVVYEAYDRVRNAIVALKVLPRVDPDSLFRFRREFRTHARLSHPNLVRLYELFSQDGRWFYTMERVGGVEFLRALRGGRTAEEAAGPQDEGDRGTDDRIQGAGRGTSDPGSPRPPRPADPERTRGLFRQVAEGLIAIHSAGLLHRDIKASNVLVRPDGGVVIVDFGLVVDLWTIGAGEASVAGPGEGTPVGDTDAGVVGTVGYMSPEQAAGRKLTAASDWYSVGVLLYEALVGRKPFTGRPSQVLKDKQSFDPPAPIDCDPRVPRDLSDLSMALLDRRPGMRPTGPEVVDRLVRRVAGAGGGPWESPTVRGRRSAPFVGRADELATLAGALGEARSGRAAVVFLSGPSGIGKSALVNSFLRACDEGEGCVTLAGRCFEQESVPFKAVDGLVDSLARFLRRLPADEASGVVAGPAPELTHLFPALRRVPRSGSGRPEDVDYPDRQELRRRAFAAFRALIARVAARRTLVLAVDDLQWGDLDSALLLTELLLPPDPPPLLLVVTYRSDFDDPGACVKTLSSALGAGEGGCARYDLALAPLGDEAARALAANALGDDDPGGRSLVEAIVHASRGDPFTIVELSRMVEGERGRLAEAAGEVVLAEVLRSRLERLPGAARRLLEVVALAAGPIPQRFAYRAAGLEHDAWPALMSLREEKLARSHGLGLDDAVVTAHDRVREAVVAGLDAPSRRALHLRLAESIRGSSSADPETLAFHSLGGGDLESARIYYEAAADRAAAALAFDRAAKLYDLAHGLDPSGEPGPDGFRLKHAEALANAGRSLEAARLFQSLADEGAGGPDSDALRQRAAYHYLISGNVDDGRAAWGAVLARQGAGIPDTPGKALRSLVVEMLRIRLRGTRFRPAESWEVDPGVLQRVDSLWAASTGLNLIDPIAAHALRIKGLRLALRAGERNRIAVGLASYATLLSYQGISTNRLTERLRAASGGLTRGCDDPYTLGYCALSCCFVDFHFMRLEEALAQAEAAEAHFSRGCRGAVWELDTSRLMIVWTNLWLGRTNRALADWEVHRLNALERNNLYTEFSLEILLGPFLRLTLDAPEEARAALRAVIGRWSRKRFELQHFLAIQGEAMIDRYLGDGRAALDRLSAEWKLLTRSMAFRSQLSRTGLVAGRAASAIMAARTSSRPRALLALARRDARSLLRERWGFAAGHAYMFLGMVAAIEGRPGRAVDLLNRSLAEFETLGLLPLAAIVKRRLGEVIGGDAGRARLAEAAEAFRAIQVADPDRFTRHYTGDLFRA